LWSAASTISRNTVFPRPFERSRRELASTIVAWNVIGSVLALLFDATFYPAHATKMLGLRFVHSPTYANCIGTFSLLIAVNGSVARRVSIGRLTAAEVNGKSVIRRRVTL
jgi:hypothetical protein